MAGFGDLFKMLGEAIDGVSQLANAAQLGGREGPGYGSEGGEGYGQTATYDRTLTGERKTLNINDR